MISPRQIISGSTGPIFATFTPNERVLGAHDRTGPLFSISQGTLPWQPILWKNSTLPTFVALYSETQWENAVYIAWFRPNSATNATIMWYAGLTPGVRRTSGPAPTYTRLSFVSLCSHPFTSLVVGDNCSNYRCALTRENPWAWSVFCWPNYWGLVVGWRLPAMLQNTYISSDLTRVAVVVLPVAFGVQIGWCWLFRECLSLA